MMILAILGLVLLALIVGMLLGVALADVLGWFRDRPVVGYQVRSHRRKPRWRTVSLAIAPSPRHAIEAGVS